MLNLLTTARAAVPHPGVARPHLPHPSLPHPGGRLRAGPRRVRAHPRREGRTSRTGQLLFGLVAVGLGVALTISAELGVASWDVLHVGLAQRAGWSISAAAAVIGTAAAGLAWLLGERPRVGGLVPVVVTGPTIDVALLVLQPAETLTGQLALLASGLIVLAIGIGAYITSDHGAGPGDLVFLAVARRGVPTSYARFLVDGGAVLAGWAIGGPVGLGTLVLTFGLAPMIHLAIRAFDLVPARNAIVDRDLRFDRAWNRELDWELRD